MEARMTRRTGLTRLMGSGDKIMLLTLPFLVVGVVLNVRFPAFFSVGGPSPALALLATLGLIPGAVVWLWSVVLILTRVPKGELITNGPYSLVKHPLYTSVGLLVIPCVGVLLNTWLGVAIGLVLYLAARQYAPREELALAAEFGAAWDRYCAKVLIPWL